METRKENHKIKHSIRQHYFITVINQHPFYINNKLQRGTTFKGTQTSVRKRNIQLKGRRNKNSEDLGALKLEMRWDTDVTETGQLTAQKRTLRGGTTMVELSLLQSKTIYPDILLWILNSTDPGQT